MKQWLFLLTVALMAAANNWSYLESTDPNVRMDQLLHQEEDIRPVLNSHFMADQPSHLTPIRVHGGIGP